MKTKIKAVALASVMAMGLAATTTAQAHPRWVLPSHFTVSKEGGDWLTFDVTASHGTFVFDKPAGSDQAFVVMPDGRSERPNFVVRAGCDRSRSGCDRRLAKGTVETVRVPVPRRDQAPALLYRG